MTLHERWKRRRNNVVVKSCIGWVSKTFVFTTLPAHDVRTTLYGRWKRQKWRRNSCCSEVVCWLGIENVCVYTSVYDTTNHLYYKHNFISKFTERYIKKGDKTLLHWRKYFCKYICFLPTRFWEKRSQPTSLASSVNFLSTNRAYILAKLCNNIVTAFGFIYPSRQNR